MAVARFIKQALIGVLAFIGALYLGFHGLVWMFFPNDTAPSTAEIVSSILAPDGQHKAVIFFLGGPGFAPGSHEYVGVVPTAQADVTAWANRNKVFQSDCVALGETYDEIKKSVMWKSAQALQITFNPNRGCAINLQDYTGEQGIRVVYVIPPLATNDEP
jgi:hypothetical protein